MSAADHLAALGYEVVRSFLRRRTKRGGGNKGLRGSIELLETRRLLSTVTWTGADQLQVWGDPGNWSTGQVPTASDSVIIPAYGPGQPAMVVTVGSFYSNGQLNTYACYSLTCDVGLDIINGATLAIGAGGAQVSQDITLGGYAGPGGLQASTLTLTNGAEIDATGEADLSLGTLYGNLNVSGGEAYISGDLTMGPSPDSPMGTAAQFLIGSADGTTSGYVDFSTQTAVATHTLAAAAGDTLDVIFGGSTNNVLYNDSYDTGNDNDPMSLIFGPGVTIEGDNGSFGAQGQYNYNAPVFINEGTINANGGGTIADNGRYFLDSLENLGTVEASGGSTLDLSGSGNGDPVLAAGSTWIAQTDSTLILAGPVSVDTGATIILNGPGSVISDPYESNALVYLSQNTGTLDLEGGQSLAITPSAVILTNDGTINLSPGSTLAIDGWFQQPPDGTLAVTLASATSYGSVSATGYALLAGTLQANAATPYSFYNGADIPVVTGGDAVNYTFDTFANNTALNLTTSYDNNDAYIDVNTYSFAAANYAIGENTPEGYATIQVVRSDPASYQTLYAGITGSDGSSSVIAANFNYGDRLATFTVPVYDQYSSTDIVDSMQLYLNYDGINLTEPTGSPSTLTIYGSQEPTALRFSADGFADDNLNFGYAEEPISLMIIKTGYAYNDATADYQTYSGSAQAGTDFTADSGSVVLGTYITEYPIGLPFDILPAAPAVDETYNLQMTDASVPIGYPGEEEITILGQQPAVAVPPIGTGISATTPQNTPITVDVLSSDTANNGEPLSFAAFDATTTQGGTVTETDNPATGEPELTYTPPVASSPDALADTFTYTPQDPSDGPGTPITVSVNVLPAAPVVNSGLVAIDSPDQIDLFLNAFDAAGLPLTYTVDTSLTAGSTIIDGQNVLYTPPPGFTTGDFDSFAYTATDPYGQSSTGTITIEYDVPPESNPSSFTVAENSSGTPLNVLAVDLSPTKPVLYIGFINSSPLHGQIDTQYISGPTGAVEEAVYTPDIGYTGTDSFSFYSSDGLEYSVAPATVTISIVTSPDLIVPSGTTTLPASSAGTGFTPLVYRNVSIGTPTTIGKVVIAAPDVPSDRDLLIAQNSLSIAGATNAWRGTIDLTGNDLEVVSGSLMQITNQIANGYNNGHWTGTGITSSTAAADPNHLTALGVILNNDGSGQQLYGGSTTASFDGQSPPLNAVLVKYTYYGDANLDGQVDGSDYSLIDNGYLKKLTGWFNGDFNYDNVINGSDYTLIDNTFNSQGASLAAQIAPQARASAIVDFTAPPTSPFSQTPAVSFAGNTQDDSLAATTGVAAEIFGPNAPPDKRRKQPLPAF